jgi:two-component system, NtrC family, sensor kinase
MDLPRLRQALSPGATAILVSSFGLWLALLVVVALLLWNERQGEVLEAKLRGAATIALLQAHTDNTFRAVDNALVDVVRTLERENVPRQDEDLRNEMRKQLTSMPYVRAIYVIGPDGYLLHDTSYPTTPDMSLADRPYFQQYLQGEAPPTGVSAPMLSRSSAGGWFVAVTRRIGKGKDFRGVAVAAIQLAYFSDLYKKMDLGEGIEILLFHRDGRLIAQHPGKSGTIGDSYADRPLFRVHLQQASSGAYFTRIGSPFHPGVVNYAALTDVPLVVAQTQNMEKDLAAWQRWAMASAAALLLLLAALLYAGNQYLRSRLDRQRRQERKIQGEKMEALGQLTGSIAHDFANILGVLATNIVLIRKLGGSEDRVEAALARAQRAVDNGEVLTRQLMAFSRKRELQVVECDANAAISSVLGLLEQAAGPQCELVFEPGELSRPCKLDRSQFEISLINLVVNARHAIEREGGRITIKTLGVSGEGPHLAAGAPGQRFVCVSVIDNGKGMPEDVRRRAGEPFFTTKGEAGTGFGLAQVYGFMQQLGGDLAIESQVGVGTAIHLYFPESASVH